MVISLSGIFLENDKTRRRLLVIQKEFLNSWKGSAGEDGEFIFATTVFRQLGSNSDAKIHKQVPSKHLVQIIPLGHDTEQSLDSWIPLTLRVLNYF